MQVFQINDEILVSHDGETSKINWDGVSVPASWQLKVSRDIESIVDTIAWNKPITAKSQTVSNAPDGKRLFVNAMMEGDNPAILVALDFAPEGHPFQVKYRGVGHEY